MRLHAVIVFALIAIFAQGSTLLAQEVEQLRPPRPDELYKFAKDKIQEGKYDLAADNLQKFLATNPPPQLYLDLQARYGTTTFLQLRNVLRWSDNPTAEAAAKATVEKIIAASEAANATVYRNPERMLKYVNNLVAKTKEERIYARQQLRPAGDAVVPVMIQVLRTTQDREHQTEILAFFSTLNDTTVPPFLAAFEALPREIQPAFLLSLTNRTDVLDLVTHAETDFTPLLWYLSSEPADTGLRQTSRDILAALTGGRSTKLQAEVELTKLSLPYYQRKAEFRTLDKVGNKVRVITWDAAKLALRTDDVPTSRAEEYYGLRNLRWALERKPNYLPAQELFVVLATERAVERAKFGDLALADPQVYTLLAAVPSTELVSLLDAAMLEKRTALVLGLIQALSDRTHKDKETSADRLSPIFKALQYPDPRVQFAAAVTILKSPASATHGQTARIVDILRRALAGEVDGGGTGKVGRVIIADPDAPRGNRLAASYRDAGFAAERVASGRELFARIARASDYDGIVIDRHIANPLLVDILGHLASDPNAARRPTLIVASTDKLRPVPLEHQLLRLALLVAVTETETVRIPEPDNKPSADIKINQRVDGRAVAMTIPQARDFSLDELFRIRSARFQRLITAADLPLNRPLQTRLELRRDQYTLAALAAKYRVSETSAPTIHNRLAALTDIIVRRTDLAGEAEKILASDTENLVRLIEQLESGLTDEQKKAFERLRIQVNPTTLALDPEIVRDPALERSLAKTVKPYRFVTVIPETFEPVTLAADLKMAAADPAQLPRDSEERTAVARAAANWLRRIATGEVAGYDARLAATELRAALRSDTFGELVVDAVARFGSADAQRELVETAINPRRPIPLRMKAADAALRHIQAFGKQTPAPIAQSAAANAVTEPDPALKAKLTVLAQQVAVTPVDLSRVISSFPVVPALPGAAPAPKAPNPDPKDPADPKEPKDPADPKEPKEPKDKPEPKDPKDPKDPPEPKEPKEPKEPMNSR